MDLEEKIARLIDPEAWKTVDRGGVVGLPSAQVFVMDSIRTTRRVIDGRTDCHAPWPKEDQTDE